MPFDKFGAMSANTEGTKPTYNATVIGFTPAAAATDFASISNPVGSGKVIRVTHIQFSGVATAAVVVDLVLIKRSTLNTLGTPTTLTAVSYDSTDIAAVGTVVTYAANPTLGTAVGSMHAVKVGLGTPASANEQEQVWEFGGSRPSKCVVLRPGECLGINYNGQTPGAGTLVDLHIEWTEE